MLDTRDAIHPKTTKCHGLTGSVSHCFPPHYEWKLFPKLVRTSQPLDPADYAKCSPPTPAGVTISPTPYHFQLRHLLLIELEISVP